MKRFSAIAAALLAVAFTVAGCSHGLRSEGWTVLFDGTEASLANWDRVGGANWRIVDGAVMADKSTTKGSSFLVSKSSYKDFKMTAEFWVSDDANSGIFIRCTDRNKINSITGYEVNIFDKRPDPSYGTGAIVRVAMVKNMPKAGGKWNTFEIYAKGPEMTIVMNGAVTVSGQDSKNPAGPIALQYGQGVVKFRKVEIKPL
jgi:hypothetical protein